MRNLSSSAVVSALVVVFGFVFTPNGWAGDCAGLIARAKSSGGHFVSGRLTGGSSLLKENYDFLTNFLSFVPEKVTGRPPMEVVTPAQLFTPAAMELKLDDTHTIQVTFRLILSA